MLGTLCHQPHPLCAGFILKLTEVTKNEGKCIECNWEEGCSETLWVGSGRRMYVVWTQKKGHRTIPSRNIWKGGEKGPEMPWVGMMATPSLGRHFCFLASQSRDLQDIQNLI